MKAQLFYLELDNRWELEELSRTSSAYTQLYSFFYSILPNTYENNEIRILYAHLPWRGGYSQCHQLKPPALAGARNPGAWTRGCSSAFTGFAPQFSACATQTPA